MSPLLLGLQIDSSQKPFYIWKDEVTYHSILFISKMLLDHVFLGPTFRKFSWPVSELQEELLAALVHRQGAADATRNTSKCRQTKVGTLEISFAKSIQWLGGSEKRSVWGPHIPSSMKSHSELLGGVFPSIIHRSPQHWQVTYFD